MEELSSNIAFDGDQKVIRHHSKSCACDMTFGLYLPPQATVQKKSVPLLWYLSGLTCTHENAMTKAGLQGYAAEHGLAVVYPDTSPRGNEVADDEAYDLGQGAGFYLNAVQQPWSKHFKMYDYILQDLTDLLANQFSQIDMSRQGITGHSMGGHGAITLALKNPERFVSLSAFAPIANPGASDWGYKQFTAYLGEDKNEWLQHDASELVADRGWKSDLLIDQGADDQFIDLLCPEAMAKAIAKRRQPAIFRMHKGYDHSYFFVSTFVEDHICFHADKLYT